MHFRWLVGAVTLACVGACAAGPTTRMAPEEYLRAGIQSYGEGDLNLRGVGIVDLNVLQQGYEPGSREYAAHNERLTVSNNGETIGLEYDTGVNSDARETLRYVLAEDRLAGIVVDGGFGFWEERADFPPRIRALSPKLLLIDLLAVPQGLTDLGPTSDRGRLIGAEAPTGEKITLHFGRNGVMREFSTRLDVPMRGDTYFRWRYLPAREIEGFGRYPSGYEIWLDDDLLRRVYYEYARAELDQDLAAVSPEIRMPPHPRANGSPEPSATVPKIQFVELTPKLFLARNVRPGFHHLVSISSTGMTVIDAPAGWLEMQVAPPLEWVEGANSATVSKRFIQALHDRFPGIPIENLVLTHWHSDHAGGVREFVAEGVTIVTSPSTRRAVERALDRSFTLARDTLEQSPRSPKFMEVTSQASLGDGDGALEVIEVGPNPHSQSMLIAHASSANILYQADLFEPASRARFPSSQRVRVMKWFVTWLDRNSLASARILAAHGSGIVESWMIEEVRKWE